MHTAIRWIAPMLLSTLAVTGCAAAQHRDWDNNPPGPPAARHQLGKPAGLAWRSGASPNQRFYRRDGVRYEFKLVSGGYYYSPRWGYWHPRYGVEPGPPLLDGYRQQPARSGRWPGTTGKTRRAGAAGRGIAGSVRPLPLNVRPGPACRTPPRTMSHHMSTEGRHA